MQAVSERLAPPRSGPGRTVIGRLIAPGLAARDAQVAKHLDKLGTQRATGTEAPQGGLIIDDQGCELARPAGFEPATDGLEGAMT